MNQKYVYIIGICGFAMSTIARWFKKIGYEVYGCDDYKSEIFTQFGNEGINVKLGSSDCIIPEGILDNKDNVIVTYSPAIHESHSKLKFFRENGYKILSRKEITRDITKDFFTISIAGTHGKTTTSSLLAHIMFEGHCNMAGFLGGTTKNYDTNFVTCGDISNPNIIIEADEFDKFFLCLKSNIEIITNVDGDHFDTYENFQNYEQAFKDFINNTRGHGVVIVHKSVYDKLIDKNREYDCYLDYYDIDNAPIHAENISIDEHGYSHFDYVSHKITITDLLLQVPGKHNINNALAVITAATYMHVNEYIIREGIRTFSGVKKRFDVVYNTLKNIVIDDYGHHPTEIQAVIKTIREIYPNRCITALFRPNQYSRTQSFLTQFAQSLDLADKAIVFDIFTDRENPIQGISNQAIVDKMAIKDKIACSPKDIIQALKSLKEHDIIVNFGAGDSETFIHSIIEYLER